jgi:formylglycine-generating enzyme required for sulfatase activity
LEEAGTVNILWNGVYYSETPEISDISFSVTTSSNTISIEHLEVEKEYYFAVRGFGSGGKGPISNFAVRGGGGTTQTVQGIELVRIPAGTFMMGSSDVEGDSDERPQHQVTISSDFYIGKYEVTQKQWFDVMGTWPGSAPSSSFGMGDNHPAYHVSWADITEVDGFLDKLNQATPGCNISGLPTDTTRYHPANVPAGCFRLPTEAEWEYAARAGTSTQYYWGDGDTLADIDPYAWYEDNSYNLGSSHPNYGTQSVGGKLPNAWGLYDMSGNVYEWVYDWYGSYTSGAKTDPTGPASASRRVKRGGGWPRYADDLRSAVRFHNVPGARDGSSGFRLVFIVQQPDVFTLNTDFQYDSVTTFPVMEVYLKDWPTVDRQIVVSRFEKLPVLGAGEYFEMWANYSVHGPISFGKFVQYGGELRSYDGGVMGASKCESSGGNMICTFTHYTGTALYPGIEKVEVSIEPAGTANDDLQSGSVILAGDVVNENGGIVNPLTFPVPFSQGDITSTASAVLYKEEAEKGRVTLILNNFPYLNNKFAYGLWSVDDLGIFSRCGVFNVKSGVIVQPVTEIPKGNNVFSCDVDLTFNRKELFISLEPMHDGFSVSPFQLKPFKSFYSF